MKQKANNIIVKIEPSEKTTKSGLIIPDTATPEFQRNGTVIDGNDTIPTGSRVWFIFRDCYTEKDESVVDNKKVLLWR